MPANANQDVSVAVALLVAPGTKEEAVSQSVKLRTDSLLPYHYLKGRFLSLRDTFHLFKRAVAASATIALLAVAAAHSNASDAINGLTGTVTNVVVAVPAAESIHRLADSRVPQDLDLKRMAE